MMGHAIADISPRASMEVALAATIAMAALAHLAAHDVEFPPSMKHRRQTLL